MTASDLRTMSRRQLTAQERRLADMEKRLEGITGEFEDLIMAVTKIVSAVYANVPNMGTELQEAVEFGNRVLEKMRKRYG